ncbi:uncharacterized protein LOC143512031 [Brachyhypopomus gauderio]|uniref:uncharacterized protein LOC143512031 n=1 Tax=Brachyhypopomus gauderio TaxID=698409 RepID=UPI0040426E35
MLGNSDVGELEEQVDSLQHVAQDQMVMFLKAPETSEEHYLQGESLSKNDSQEKPHEADVELPSQRHSVRARCPTEKMRAFQREEAEKREKRLLSRYDQWKIQARKAREQLMSDIPESQLGLLIDTLEKGKDDIMKMFFEIRDIITPTAELRRRVDACEAVTKDIVKIAYERIAGVDGEFNAEHEKGRLQELLDHVYAHSIYGSVISQRSSKSGLHSIASSVVAKRADAAADLAAKEAEYEMLLEERKHREIIEQQQRALEVQRHELERLQAERELKAARARLEAYNEEAAREAITHIDSDHRNKVKRETSATNPAAVCQSNDAMSPLAEVSLLAQAFQDNMALSRLPVPEPFVFVGDPIQFLEWKSCFQFLIDRRCISPGEKLFYLKKYVGGPARKVLEGTFYRNDREAFQDAWSKLNQRYGQPFAIQRAFRTRLANWTKIQSKDALGLRELSDFLSSCKEAIPYVKGLEILNDCEENQKIVQKLPDWAASRWNRQVTQALTERQEFPTFEEFAAFIAMEAEVACNPITSFHALHSLDSSSDKCNPREHKKTKAHVLSSQVITDTESQRSSRNGEKPPCVLCQDHRHRLHGCPKFTAMSLEERRNYVKERKLCYGCLKAGHNAKECHRRHTCDTCKRKHPTCLHDDSYQKKETSAPSSDSSRVNATETATSMSLSIAGESTLNTSMVVPVWVSAKSNPCRERLVYALLDTQSDTTFVDHGVSDILQAEKYPVKLKLTTMSGKGMILPSERVLGLRVRGYSSAEYIELPPTYTKDCIPLNYMHIPTCETVSKWAHLSEIADEIQPLKDCEVGLLIGYNCPRALAPKQVILGGDDEPFAIRTDLGWSVVGRSSPTLDSLPLTNLCHRTSVKELPLVTPTEVIRALESDFQDGTKDSKTVSQDDVLFLSQLGESIRKNSEGHYEMPLPFKRRPSLPDNKNLAVLRLNHLKRKLAKDKKYKEHYVKFMEEVICKGDAEEVQDTGVEGEKWYIPHHGIYHTKKPDKLRVVFDCSASYKGTSLNDHLLSGPDLLNNLIGVLIRFRQHPIALMCDVERMFHQFHVHEADRNFLRFLWWSNGDFNTVPKEFRMRVHLFGAASSPGCANYGLKYLAKENKDLYPLGAQFVTRDFYVDDGVASVGSIDDAIQLAREAQKLCASGGLRLHKFVSNNRAVLDSIPPSERSADVGNLDLAFDDLPLERTLGIQWDPQSDSFKFSISLKGQPATRRGVLSTVASLYDPLGLVAPFVLNGKSILQEACRRGTGWDDDLGDELQSRWEDWRYDLANLDQVTISRSYAPHGFGKVTKTELHHFSDASTKGYGQCSYLRFCNERGDVHCALVIGKSRVAPTKVTTIPRLELTAAVVSVKMSNMLKEELASLEAEEFFWTDSKVVLGYIKNEARRFHTFVANRVQRIHLGSNPRQWRYVASNENPADHASRGLTPKELMTSTWFTGPKFLWKEEFQLPADVTPELELGDPEVRRARSLRTQTLEQENIISRLSRFSSWSRAVRAVARILRYINRNKSKSLTTMEERDNAEYLIIRNLQGEIFQEELSILSRGNPLPSHNRLLRLNAFIDKDGILKVGGRLGNSSLANSFKHPTILPKDHHITRLIIAHNHEKVEHQGKGFTLNQIRANGYWIPGISRAVAAYIHHCITCKKLRKPVEEQKMADLPPERIERSAPFTYSGMDCFGPFATKQGRKVHKRYGLLFTCFYSRAIHIEMLDDMSTDAFINSLRCFIGIRGAVRQIKSDQGSNFVGAKHEFTEALKEVDSERIATFLAEKQCDFIMNAPCASHAGGVWERQIRTVRSILRSTMALSSDRLNDASLRAFLYEAMAIVNSRPLTVDNLSDPNSLEPLTPNHLLTQKSDRALPPPGEFVREDIYGKKRWRHVQYLAEQFWSRWRKEYLTTIATRQRWHSPKRNMQTGDIVLIKDDDLPRCEWRLGRVSETTRDKDGFVRRVKVHLGDKQLGKKGERLSKLSVLERPVQKLVLLQEAG